MSFMVLGDIVKIKGGKRLPKSSQLQVIKNDHPYIRVRDMGERYLPRNGLEYVPDNVFPSISRYIVNTNDLILSIVGTVGLVSIVDEYFNNASLTENCVKLTGLDEKDAKYLYYYLLSQYGKEEIKARTVGAVQPKLPLYNIEKIQIRWFDKLIREKIVTCLSTLDDKIQLNNQTNQNLESIAQAIFKSWFVDFEPVRAKIAAKQTGQDLEFAAMCAISGKSEAELEQMAKEDFAELQATAALFPDELVESELGEVPKGWLPVNIEYFIELIYGKALKKTERIHGVYPVYGSGGLTGWHNKALVKGPGVIIGRKGTIGSIFLENKDFYPIDTTYYVKTKNNCSLLFAYYLLQTLGLEKMNTDAAVPGLNRQNFYHLEVPFYSSDLIGKYTKTIEKIISKNLSIKKENEYLIEMRDSLLPKLLSGEMALVDVIDA